MRKRNIFNPNLSRLEKQEFEIHVKHNMKRAYFTALSFVGSHDSAIDLSQEAFIRAYRNYKNFDKRKKFFTWYYKILKNLCLNFIRDSRKITQDNFLESEDKLVNPDNPEQIFEMKEMRKQVQTALFSLSPNEREIIILKEFQGLSYKEIAELMEIPIGSVMSRLYYSRKKLADKLRGLL